MVKAAHRGARRVVAGALILVPAFLCVPLARAQPASAPNAAAADKLFQEGQSLFGQGKTAEACAKFEESNRLDPAPGTLNNLAVCHEKQGKTATAWREWTALGDLARAAHKTEREKDAQRHATDLEKKLSRVQLATPPGVHVATITLDGAVLDPASLSGPFPVDPGSHTFEAIADGGRKAQSAVTVPSDGSSVTVRFDTLVPPKPAPALPVVRRPPPLTPSNTNRTVAWVLVGVGAAGIVTGGVFGLLANGAKNDTPNDDAFTYAYVADAAFGVGLAAAAAGAVFFLLPAQSSSSPHSEEALRLLPAASPGGASLQLQGTF